MTRSITSSEMSPTRNPVPVVKSYTLPSTSLAESDDVRMDAGHYNPVVFEALDTLAQSGMKLKPLRKVTRSVYLPARFKRIYVEKDAGLPFLQGSHVVQFQPADVKYLSPRSYRNISKIVIKAGWLLVTRSGTVGRVALCPREWDGWAASEHIIRVVADKKRCPAGYLCAFLASPLGQAQLSASIHGAVVDELTDKQVGDVLVPVPQSKADWSLVNGIDKAMRKSLKLSANSWFVNPGGSDGSLPLPSRLSHTLNTCFVFLLCS